MLVYNEMTGSGWHSELPVSIYSDYSASVFGYLTSASRQLSRKSFLVVHKATLKAIYANHREIMATTRAQRPEPHNIESRSRHDHRIRRKPETNFVSTNGLCCEASEGWDGAAVAEFPAISPATTGCQVSVREAGDNGRLSD